MIDLHCHSTASDGITPPEELPHLAENMGLSALALTDHDTVDGIAEFLECSCITTVPGVELSARTFDKGKCHIVGLGIDHTNPVLKSTLADLCKKRDVRNEKIVQNLIDLGFDITMEEVRSIADGVVGRPHIAEVLVAHGICKDFKEAFRLYLNDAAPTYVPRETLDIESAIRLIHGAGGVAIWAHPMNKSSMTNAKFCSMLDSFVELGLDGVEAYYPDHTASKRLKVIEEATRRGLLVSGGSDYHGGDRHSGILPGHYANGASLDIPDMLLELILQRTRQ